MIWYKQPIDAVYSELNSSPDGLKTSELSARKIKYGQNKLELEGEPLWKIILEPFRSVFVAVLVAAALISFLSHEYLDGTIVMVIVLINAGIYYSQQYATDKVLRSLRNQDKQSVTVKRDGQTLKISSEELLPGDILYLDEGNKVPADARVISQSNIQVDEASLTGESRPVSKHNGVLSNDKEVYERSNMLFSGTYVTKGAAEVIVVNIGNQTEFGKIADLTVGETTSSPVQQKIDHLVTLMIKIIAVLALLTFGLTLLRGIPTNEALRFVLAFAVSAVPEGLPVALTVIIVLGMRRLAKQQALVRSFKAIEDIGLITAIATDKTGTLTKNKLSVSEQWSPDNSDIKKFSSMTLGPASTLDDALDIAIAEYSNTSHQAVDKYYPFDLSLKMSGVYSKKDKLVYIKGAPEHLLSMSKPTSKIKKLAESKLHEFASQGQRVIALASLSTSSPPNDLSDLKGKIKFVGFISLADELRSEATESIRLAKQAGIKVSMITGDHYETAFNISKKLGLATHPQQVIQGTDLPKKVSALARAIKDKTVFARIIPEDKFRILKALKKDEITAMTGDGVNDVPAISNAHVGIAMGSGSDIAKDSSGIILLDDNFTTIVNAIKEGRTIFENIRKMLFYLIATSIGEVLAMMGALIIGLPLPVTAIQVLWLNIVTDSTMVLPVGLEPAEDDIMDQPPRHPKQPILDKVIITRMFLVAGAMALVTIATVAILKAQDHHTEYIQTVAFVGLAVGQWVNAFNARSETKSIFSRKYKKNNGLLVGLAISFALQVMVMVGPLRSVFDIADVPVSSLILSAVAMTIAVIAISEIHKLIVRYSRPRPKNRTKPMAIA